MPTEPFGFNPNLPHEIRQIFMELCQDLADLRDKWDFYVALFSTREITGLLSETAPGAFIVIEESLRNDLTMLISRLSDPAEASDRENGSFLNLAARLADQQQIDLIHEFINACQPVRKLRNQRVSHPELISSIVPIENPLPGISRDHIEHIIGSAEIILNLISKEYHGSELIFKPFYTGGVDRLLFFLREGMKSGDRSSG